MQTVGMFAVTHGTGSFPAASRPGVCIIKAQVRVCECARVCACVCVKPAIQVRPHHLSLGKMRMNRIILMKVNETNMSISQRSQLTDFFACCSSRSDSVFSFSKFRSACRMDWLRVWKEHKEACLTRQNISHSHIQLYHNSYRKVKATERAQ